MTRLKPVPVPPGPHPHPTGSTHGRFQLSKFPSSPTLEPENSGSRKGLWGEMQRRRVSSVSFRVPRPDNLRRTRGDKDATHLTTHVPGPEVRPSPPALSGRSSSPSPPPSMFQSLFREEVRGPSDLRQPSSPRRDLSGAPKRRPELDRGGNLSWKVPTSERRTESRFWTEESVDFGGMVRSARETEER